MQLITCLFNPCGYRKPVENMKTMLRSIGREVFVVELLFDGQDQQIEGSFIMRTSTDYGCLWHKERLLNLACRLKPSDQYCWLDGDVLFTSSTWYDDTRRILDRCPVAQPFATVSEVGNPKKTFPSYAAIMSLDVKPTWHAKPGYAFAWNKESLKLLPDLGICGGGDLLTWASLTGQWDHPVFQLAGNRVWRSEVFKQVLANGLPPLPMLTAAAPGHLKYLPHGTKKNRRYNKRYNMFTDFDPTRDLGVDEHGLYYWRETRYNDRMLDYFKGRQEDEETSHVRDANPPGTQDLCSTGSGVMAPSDV